MRAVFALLLLLAACGRPLSDNEVSFAQAVHGPSVATNRVRLHNGFLASSVTLKRPVRPRLTCQERLFPPSKGETISVSPAALALFNRVYLRRDLWRDDLLQGWPQQMGLLDAMLVAHEMTHVWQWQNRASTGYHPLKALGEHTGSSDPYLIDPETKSSFLDHGYEQQGVIVEEYVCCRVLDPDAPRTARLRAMIGAAFPIDQMDALLRLERVRLPWDGAQIDGICR